MATRDEPKKPSLNRRAPSERNKPRRQENLSVPSNLPPGARPITSDYYGSSNWRTGTHQAPASAQPQTPVTQEPPAPGFFEKYPIFQLLKYKWDELKAKIFKKKAAPDGEAEDRLSGAKEGLNKSKEKAKEVWGGVKEKSKAPLEKASQGAQVAKEKAGNALGKAKEAVKNAAATAKSKMPKPEQIPGVKHAIAAMEESKKKMARQQLLKALEQATENLLLRQVVHADRLNPEDYGLEFIEKLIESGEAQELREEFPDLIPKILTHRPDEAQFLIATKNFLDTEHPYMWDEEYMPRLVCLCFVVCVQVAQENLEQVIYALANVIAQSFDDASEFENFLFGIRQRWGISGPDEAGDVAQSALRQVTYGRMTQISYDLLIQGLSQVA